MPIMKTNSNFTTCRTDQKLLFACQVGQHFYPYFSTIRPKADECKKNLLYVSHQKHNMKRTNKCGFWVTGRRFKINHTEVVALTNFGSKLILILNYSLAHLGVFSFLLLFFFNVISVFV